MHIKEYAEMMRYLTKPRSKDHGSRTKDNPTLVKNMKHVKFDAIPPVSGPNPQGLIKSKK